MKQVILSIVFLISAGACFGQQHFNNGRLYSGRVEKINKIYVEVDVDTVEISNKQIRFIKIDGIVYEIKRSTTIQEVKPIAADTSNWFRLGPNIQFYPSFNHIKGGTASQHNGMYAEGITTTPNVIKVKN